MRLVNSVPSYGIPAMLCVFCLLEAVHAGILGPRNPPWPPAYDMARSTLTMTCNGSGWSSPKLGARFGIVSYDWSNAKKEWAAAKPMDCEERLATQASQTVAYSKVHGGGTARAFVYRNVVKALPWFSAVRAILEDPAYSGFFLHFDPSTPKQNYNVKPCAAENGTKCSAMYHDQMQTPAVPTAAAPNPDGSCTEKECDCGDGIPCGECVCLESSARAATRPWR